MDESIPHIVHRTAAEKADLKGIKNSLLKLTQLMELHYQKPVILIIDEYDVPLAKASEKGYYREMQDAIKGSCRSLRIIIHWSLQ